MQKARFANQDGDHSFFGQFLYDQIISPDHFYRKLNDITDWQRFTKKLIKCYRGQGTFGRPPFNPAIMVHSGQHVMAVLSDSLSHNQPGLWMDVPEYVHNPSAGWK